MSEDRASDERMGLSKDLGKVAGRVAVLETNMGGIGTTLEKIDGRLASIEEHSRKVCMLADVVRFLLKVAVPAAGVLAAMAFGMGWLP